MKPQHSIPVYPPGSLPNPIRPRPQQPRPIGNGQGPRAW